MSDTHSDEKTMSFFESSELDFELIEGAHSWIGGIFGVIFFHITGLIEILLRLFYLVVYTVKRFWSGNSSSEIGFFEGIALNIDFNIWYLSAKENIFLIYILPFFISIYAAKSLGKMYLRKLFPNARQKS